MFLLDRSTTTGAMTLQGPHQVAKQSIMIEPFWARASLNSWLLGGGLVAV